jgi:signal-transduction protein with cAMP-binding, CBS, and nucleotidyltransferase domain
MEIGSVLKGHNIFKLLTVDEVARISEFSSEKRFRRNETIYTREKAVSHAFLNLSGVIDLRLPAKPPVYHFTIDKIGEGELFGIASLLGSERYTASAVAVEDTIVLAMEARPLRALIQSNSTAGYRIINQVALVYFGRYMTVMGKLQDMFSQITRMHQAIEKEERKWTKTALSS